MEVTVDGEMWADSGNVSVFTLVQFASGIGLGHEEKWESHDCSIWAGDWWCVN